MYVWLTWALIIQANQSAIITADLQTLVIKDFICFRFLFLFLYALVVFVLDLI